MSAQNLTTLLEYLSDQVQLIHLQTQSCKPEEKAGLRVLYRKAYLAYREHKAFLQEQELILAAA